MAQILESEIDQKMEQVSKNKLELKAQLLTKNMESDLSVSQIEDNGTDYVLRCIKGMYRGMFIYLNLVESGETIGSDDSCTLQMEDCGLERTHVKIKYKYNEEQKKNGYHLTCFGPTLIKIRYDCPALIKNNMEITIGKQIYIIQTVQEGFNEILEWLSMYDLQGLKHFFFGNNINNLKQLKQNKIDQLISSVQSYSATQDQLIKLREAYNQIDDIILQNYDAFKINLLDKQKNTIVLQFGWTGAKISSKTQRYQKPPDILLKKQEIDDLEENPDFELLIKFIQGKYWIWGSKTDTYNTFYKQNKEETRLIQPDDVIKLNKIELLVQRFNYGYFQDLGTKRTQEDNYTIIQDLQVSSRVPVSCYAIFDGHNGNSCVNYMSQNLMDNIREYFNQEQKEFDHQNKFLAFLFENIRAAFKETDSDFLTDVVQANAANDSGCVAVVVMIIGDYIVSINCGDSRAILSRQGEAINLTEDHKPNIPAEQARIKRKGGGEIIGGRLGNLAVSRAFGDFSEKKKFKKNVITPKPDVRVTKIDYRTDEFILLCSDGIIDGFGNAEQPEQNFQQISPSQRVIEFVRNMYKEQQIGFQDPQDAAQQVVLRAYQYNVTYRRQSDNISCIIVNLTRGIVF
ncbi:unnamed protein product [Paramecium pentaurelia]|uniref:PPM-type phosphatase domain-containing protein n=1 Tax=Paramecium pentaurelia TaxID=43138 RepID=A0A8S1SS65_9CILI|nr:unnamed protein product [Paramecium pentaurelia]